MSRRAPNTQAVSNFEADSFVVLRTPILPFEEYEAWTTGLTAPGSEASREELQARIAADRQRLRDRLFAFLERPEILEALFVASPSLVEGLETYRESPKSKKGERAEQSLVRYLMRMMTRPTPFGLFAGYTVGRTQGATTLRLAPADRYRRHTRLDMDYLFKLVQDLERDAEIRRKLRLRPNSSLYRAAGRLRYAESRLSGKLRSHHLVALHEDEFLDAALARAADGAPLTAIAEAVVARDADGEIDLEEAEAYVNELVDAQVLVSDMALPVTGREPIHGLIEDLSRIARTQPVANHLSAVRDRLETLDAAPIGSGVDVYQGIAKNLEELGTEVELARLFQVDLAKPAAELVVGKEVVEELQRCIRFLDRFRNAELQDGLQDFREAFLGRYEMWRAVPLVEVLDEETGIGFQRSQAVGTEHSPLLEGLSFPRRLQPPTLTWGQGYDLILRKLDLAARQGALEISFADGDLEGFEDLEPAPLSDAVSCMFSIAASSPEALAGGDFRVLMGGASGPSGARLLGRFCHGDETLTAEVERHLRREEALDPGSLFAEIAHLPEGRLGNILLRPALREYEIPFLAGSGVAEDKQIPLSDLLVSVAGQQVVLWSKRLRRRVIPRLTSAHNYTLRSLGIYRFLCQLQQQGVRGGVGWDWGPFARLPFLPRVVYGRTVLSQAQWRWDADEIKQATSGDAAGRFQSFREIQQNRKMPRWVLLADGDNQLLLDFDNSLAIDAVGAVIKRRSEAAFQELFPDPSELLAVGPEGRFTHELNLPMVQARAPRSDSGEMPTFLEPTHFAPGSEWVYAKLYTGSATADHVLRGLVQPLVDEVRPLLKQWFFIRYGDPGWHLRVRLRAATAADVQPLLAALCHRAEELLRDGILQDMKLDVYQPEIERYGGPVGLELGHELFHADSDAVLAILDTLEGDAGAEARWLITLRGIDDLVGDLLGSGDSKLQCVAQMRSGFAHEFRVDSAMRKRLGDRLRKDRAQIEAFLQSTADGDHPLAPSLQILARRSERIRQVGDRLREAGGKGELAGDRSVDDTLLNLTTSYVHMFVNRMMRADARAHELVLYDFLHRHLLSRMARKRQAKKG